MKSLEKMRSELQGFSVNKLKILLAETYKQTAESLLRCAAIVAELEKHEADLSDVDIPILPTLRRIACGQILPELVAGFGGNGTLLQLAQNLPLADQQKIVSDAALPVLVRTPGGIDKLMVRPSKMTAKQARQVIGKGKFRDDGEQRSYLQENSRPPVEAEGDVILDPKHGGVTINGKWLSRAELASILSRLG